MFYNDQLYNSLLFISVCFSFFDIFNKLQLFFSHSEFLEWSFHVTCPSTNVYSLSSFTLVVCSFSFLSRKLFSCLYFEMSSFLLFSSSFIFGLVFRNVSKCSNWHLFLFIYSFIYCKLVTEFIVGEWFWGISIQWEHHRPPLTTTSHRGTYAQVHTLIYRLTYKHPLIQIDQQILYISAYRCLFMRFWSDFLYLWQR